MRRALRLLAGGAGGSVPAPVNTVAPTVSLPALYEVNETATCNPGTWTNATSYEYRWTLRGTPITGATASTYALIGQDLGGVPGPALTSALFGDALFSNGQGPTLSCEVRATGPGGVSAWVPASNNLRFQWSQYSNITQLLDERGITAAGSEITAWANQGSVVASFTQGVSLQRPATGAAVNGFAAPSFRTATTVQRLDTANPVNAQSFWSPPANTTHHRYFWRIANWIQFPTITTNGVRPSQLPDLNSGNGAWQAVQDNAGAFSQQTGVAANVAPTGYRISTQAVGAESGIHSQETRCGGGAIVGRYDGVDGSSVTFNGTAAPTATFGTRVGANYILAAPTGFDYDLATEVCIDNGTAAITSKQLQTVRAVLAGKYNVPMGYTLP